MYENIYTYFFFVNAFRNFTLARDHRTVVVTYMWPSTLLVAQQV